MGLDDKGNILGFDHGLLIMKKIFPKKQDMLGIVPEGEDRLREAVEAKIRAKYQSEVECATDPKKKAEIKRKIKQEIEQEMRRTSSPYSLWGSQ